MKNIAIFIPTIRSGGAEKQATLLAEILSRSHTVHFISFYGDYQAAPSNIARLQASDVQLHLLKGGPVKKLNDFRRILKGNHIEIAFNYLTFCDVFGSIVENLSDVKTIYNGIRNSRLPHFKSIAEKFCHNHIATGTIFNCYSGADYFERQGFDKTRSIVIPNCFPDITAEIQREDQQTKNIITVGRFVEQKDYLTAIKTIAALKNEQIDIRFTIVGYGELEQQIRLWVEKYDIADITQILINPTNIPELLATADIYLSTSLFEGTSNSIMEAMNYSLPVVATHVGDNFCLVESGENGFLHPIGDVTGLVVSLKTLLGDSNLRNKFGITGNRLLKSRYSTRIFGEKYKKLIG